MPHAPSLAATLAALGLLWLAAPAPAQSALIISPIHSPVSTPLPVRPILSPTPHAAAPPTSAATVTVNAAASLATFPATGVGVNTAVWDGNLLDPAVPSLLSGAGVTTLRFPGGSTSDVYHWQTGTVTSGYANSADTFDAFMGVARLAGASPIITVNYGCNPAGNAGGDPNEAAAWVDYANNTKKYGVKYWEVGNEVYGNGEYGSAWEEDLHPDHSPSAYGANVVLYANAMKAKDPTIKVGAVLTSPGDWPDGQSPDWNSAVLAACGPRIDFVVVHWYAQSPGAESDAGLLASPSALPGKVAKLRALITQYCGANAPNVAIFVTETNSVSYNPGKQTVSQVNGLFAADDYLTWLENGVANVDWWDLHNGADAGNNNSGSLYGSAAYGDYGLLANGSGAEPAADTPFAPYYALQMLSNLGLPGDHLVAATSSQGLLAVHAVQQTSGSLALLLVNKDPAQPCAATVSVSGFTPSGLGTVYTYGLGSTAITSSPAPVGSTFTQTVPPYSLTTIVLSPSGSGGTPPVWNATGRAFPTLLPTGGTAMLSATVTDTGGAYAHAIVDLEVYNAAGVRVGQQYFSGQNFSAGSSHAYTWAWTAPLAPGAYRLVVGVFNADWSSDLFWNSRAASLAVAAPKASVYDFESGTEGWASSGGMITGISTSAAQAVDGTQSLAVSFAGASADTQQVFVGSPTVLPGRVVTFHVWVPAGSAISAVQPYVQQGAAGNWQWTGQYKPVSALTPGAWNTISVQVPASAVTPLFQLGVQFFTSAPWTGTCYVDAVGW